MRLPWPAVAAAKGLARGTVSLSGEAVWNCRVNDPRAESVVRLVRGRKRSRCAPKKVHSESTTDICEVVGASALAAMSCALDGTIQRHIPDRATEAVTGKNHFLCIPRSLRQKPVSN